MLKGQWKQDHKGGCSIQTILAPVTNANHLLH